jgi:hypothetical protein
MDYPTHRLRVVADICRPVRTFNTAVVYYHKFRLLHADTEYNYVVCTHLEIEDAPADDSKGRRCGSIVHCLQD